MPPLTCRKRWFALGALTLAVLTIGFDITIMNVALPTMANELDTGTDGLQWIVNAYILVFAGLLLPFGSIADRFGRRRLLLIGLAVFAAASMLAAWADDVAQVVAARALLGVGAAIIMPAALAALADMFPAAERGKALSIMVMGMGAGIPLGPIIGGALLEEFWWGSIFLVNVPIVVLAMIATMVLLPESRDPKPPRADLLGALVSTAGLMVFVYGVIEAPDLGWGHPVVLAALILGIALIAGFIWWELRIPQPMIDLHLFRGKQFTWGNINATITSFVLFGLLFVIPQYLQFVLGHDAFASGIRLLPLIGGFVIGVGAGTRIAGRIGHRTPIAAGLFISVIGLGVGATTSIDSEYAFAAIWYAIAGLGIGAALTPSMDAVLAVLPPERAGSGTAITMTLRQAGGALGVALLGSLLSQVYIDGVDTAGLPGPAADTAHDSVAGALRVAQELADPALALSAQTAYIDGVNLVLIACAATAFIGAILTIAFMPRKQAAAEPERAAAQAG
jgi:EmrB/QacA subfamily drug resistance transporter